MIFTAFILTPRKISKNRRIHNVDPTLITHDSTILTVLEISVIFGQNKKEIANPGMNSTNKKPKIILKNPKRVVVKSAIPRHRH